MLFLADENCDFAVVRALRSAGHDVTSVAELSPRVADDFVLNLARREKRLLLTEDKDFGNLVYADSRATAGVILIRYSSRAARGVPRFRSRGSVCGHATGASTNGREEIVTKFCDGAGHRAPDHHPITGR